MAFRVFLTDDAAGDLEDIVGYVERHDAPGKAARVLERIENAFASLSENPERGVCPRELQALGVREYREIFFKPYRTIHRAVEQRVYVILIADGRRDMQSLLQRRLLQP